MARLSEVTMRFGILLIESSSRQGALCVLSDLRSRLGEKSSPKRDEEVQPLLHACSSEVG